MNLHMPVPCTAGRDNLRHVCGLAPGSPIMRLKKARVLPERKFSSRGHAEVLWMRHWAHNPLKKTIS